MTNNVFRFMPPCCQIPPGPPQNFGFSLQLDAERFSKYVGGGNLAAPNAANRYLTSGLHFEMKLWPPSGRLPWIYKYNDAHHNAWAAMSNRTTAPAVRFNAGEKCGVFEDLRANFPHRSKCALLEYDRWILSRISHLRGVGLGHAGLPGQKPPELGTVGLVQKLINIYVKYEFCWQIVGKWQANPHPGCFAPYAPAISPQDFLCALHAPIDRRVINEVLRLPIGQYLIRAHGLLRSGLIRQSSDNSFQPWSKIDCLRTYYGFQLVFRRLAMATWPNVCACFGSGATMASCGKMFEKEFAGGPKCTGPNWIQITADIPDDIIQQSLLEIEANRESETTSL